MHIPVLLDEVIDGLNPQRGETILDGTIGFGGHAKVLCDRIGSDGLYIGLDEDATAIAGARDALSGCRARVILEQSNFRNLARILTTHGIVRIDKALFDFGLSSYQIDMSGRGFSFQKDEPLVMTLSAHPGAEKLTARDIVNEWDEEAIANVIYAYGEEQFARPIAKKIVALRDEQPIETTRALADIVSKAVPAWYRHKKIHPATKTFQALRIAINDELDAIREGLASALVALSPGGRIAAISFHSGEDRIVKRLFQTWEMEGKAERHTKKPITPSEKEQKENPRARSAKLRIIQKL